MHNQPIEFSKELAQKATQEDLSFFAEYRKKDRKAQWYYDCGYKHGQENLDHYHKAIQEIEEVCMEDTRTFADGTQVRYESLDRILDIINKVKRSIG